MLSAVVALVLSATIPLAPVASDAWACAPTARDGFATDPVVHPPDVPLVEIAAAMPVFDSRFFLIDDRGRTAVVTYRDAAGLIVTRVVFSRGVETGWRLERSLSCSQTPRW